MNNDGEDLILKLLEVNLFQECFVTDERIDLYCTV